MRPRYLGLLGADRKARAQPLRDADAILQRQRGDELLRAFEQIVADVDFAGLGRARQAAVQMADTDDLAGRLPQHRMGLFAGNHLGTFRQTAHLDLNHAGQKRQVVGDPVVAFPQSVGEIHIRGQRLGDGGCAVVHFDGRHGEES